MAHHDRDDRLELNGEVVSTNKGIFKVYVSEGHTVNCKLGGKLKMLEIKVIVGDIVDIHVSPYDVTVGRIVRRIRQAQA